MKTRAYTRSKLRRNDDRAAAEDNALDVKNLDI